jgi:D-alanyl-D-alanine carboxypeptidase
MKKYFPLFLIVFIFCFFCFSCSKKVSSLEGFSGTIQVGEAQMNNAVSSSERETDPHGETDATLVNTELREILLRAGLPEAMAKSILYNASTDPSFIMDLLAVLEDDPYYYLLVDKQHPLPSDYAPLDLINLSDIKNDASYLLNRNDLSLRKAAVDALEEMAAAAKIDGITLLASSTYRSYDYQKQVYARNVAELGELEANRVSAKPGESQHQLGLIVDFGSITNDFAESKAGLWIAENASTYGWSLSFPRDYEEVTGYDWESWHFRYVGKNLSYFIDAYFDGIQQYALQFIDEWLKG